MRIAGWHAGLALAAIIAAAGSRAEADPQVDKADQLFAEGKALMSSNLLQACDKFEESLRINPAAIGTLLNLALCDEKLGRIATAVERFRDARNRAREQNLPEHLRAAEDHLSVLEPSVPHVAIQLTEPLPDTTVLVDGRTVVSDQLGSIAIDPGERVVVVSAIGRLPYRVQFVIGKAENKTIVVPRLAHSVTVTSSAGRIGQITVVTGGVAFVTSIGLALYGRRLHDQQFEVYDRENNLRHCVHTDGMPDRCDSVGQPLNDRARTYGTVGTYVGSIGLVAIAVGGYLWLRSPRTTPRTDTKLVIAPDVSGSAAGVTAIGRF